MIKKWNHQNKKYNYYKGKLLFEGEYLKRIKHKIENHIMKVIWVLKENFQIEKKEKVKNF